MPVTGCIPFTEVTDFIIFCSVMTKNVPGLKVSNRNPLVFYCVKLF